MKTIKTTKLILPIALAATLAACSDNAQDEASDSLEMAADEVTNAAEVTTDSLESTADNTIDRLNETGN